MFDLQFGILITALMLCNMYKADNIILVKHLWESQTRKPKEIKQHFFFANQGIVNSQSYRISLQKQNYFRI